ncbi:RDD family protein [Actinomadura latina]|uniref:RDD family protein n=1 Tax=Actinomadura latina TaxID=163603 RepID=A0A846Z0M6_9ACTN|nr:RDD family protein [Actinomadura latina]NKZ06379.1 RDD family protein [Actinomadura latina]
MTQPPRDPASGGGPEENRPHGHEEPGRPGPYEGGPYGGLPRYGEQSHGQQQQPQGGQPPYGEHPYGEHPYGEQPYGQAPHGAQPGYGNVPGYGAGGYGGPRTELAGRWARLAAGILDLIIVGIAAGLISIPFINWDRVFNPEPGTSFYNGAQVGTNAVSVVIAFLYFWLMHARWGQTLGKMLLGIRVVRDEDGQAISNGQALGRSAFYSVLGGICGCIGFIDILWILFDPRKQALHCKVAHTIVVKADPGLPNPYESR